MVMIAISMIDQFKNPHQIEVDESFEFGVFSNSFISENSKANMLAKGEIIYHPTIGKARITKIERSMTSPDAFE
jgi:hypothetical protein